MELWETATIIVLIIAFVEIICLMAMAVYGELTNDSPFVLIIKLKSIIRRYGKDFQRN